MTQYNGDREREAYDDSRPNMIVSIGVGIVLAVVISLLGGYLGHDIGRDAGYNDGFDAAAHTLTVTCTVETRGWMIQGDAAGAYEHGMVTTYVGACPIPQGVE